MNISYGTQKEYIDTMKQINYSDEMINKILSNPVSILKVRYVDPEFPTLYFNENGNWIDLKCTKDYSLKAGESEFIDLGVAMKLPRGCEAHLLPRSGTFRKYGLLQTNGTGIIDDSYSGNDDIWKMNVYATRDTEIKKGERLCQFRLFPTMEALFSGSFANCFAANSFGFGIKGPGLTILVVDKLDDVNRGGFGSTGL